MDSEKMSLIQNQCFINDIDFLNEDFDIFNYENLLVLEILCTAFLCTCLFFL